MKSCKSQLMILSLSVAALVIEPVVAQEIEEIVVTARKIDESIHDAPISVNVITASQLEDAGVTQTADYIQLIPNVSLAESQTAGTAFLTVRGLSRVRNGELPVAVVVDGVVIVNARQFTGQVFDTQQIEFVKGPQGAIYGRNASNGAVIITTKAPSTEGSEGHIKLGYGTADEVSVQGSFSAPLTDNLAFRLSGNIVERDGYFTNITLDDEVDPLSDRTLRGRLTWVPSNTLKVDFKAEVAQVEGKGIGFHLPGLAIFGNQAVVDELGVSAADILAQGSNLTGLPYVANNPDRGYRETFGASLRIDKELSWASLKSVTTFDELTTSSVADRAPYLSVLDGTQHSFVDVDGWSQEIRLSSNSDGRIRWGVGAYYLSWERLRTTATGIDLGQGIKRPTTVPENENSTNPTGLAPGNFLSFVEDSYDVAVFFNVDIDVTDDLTLSLAGRHDSETREQTVNPFNTAGRLYSIADDNGVNLPYAATACESEPDEVPNVNCGSYATFTDLLANTQRQSIVNKRKYSLFQPKVTLAYSVSEVVNVYGSWGVGFRAGQYNYPGIEIISATASEAIDQEENSTFEIGLKAEWDTLRINLAYFNSKVDNTQYFPFDAIAFVQVFEDVDEAELDGIELEAYWKPNENWDLYASYGSTNSEITAYRERASVVGNDLPYVPEETFNLGARFQWGVGNGLIAFIRTDYEHRGEQFWTPENSFPRDALELVNVRLGLEGEQWSTSLYVNNATDELYNSEVVTPLFLHPAPPRVVRWDARYKF